MNNPKVNTFCSRMIQIMKPIFVIIIINLGSGESACQPGGRKLGFQDGEILKTSFATEDPDGYSYNWFSGLTFADLAGCFDEVTFYYNGPTNKTCCRGYKKVSKYPKKKDVEPFVLKGYCSDDRKAMAYFKARIGKQALTMKYTVKTLKVWPCDEDKKELMKYDMKQEAKKKEKKRKEEEERKKKEKRKKGKKEEKKKEEKKSEGITTPFIIGGVVLTVIFIIIFGVFWFMCLRKKTESKDDNEDSEGGRNSRSSKKRSKKSKKRSKSRKRSRR